MPGIDLTAALTKRFLFGTPAARDPRALTAHSTDRKSCSPISCELDTWGNPRRDQSDVSEVSGRPTRLSGTASRPERARSSNAAPSGNLLVRTLAPIKDRLSPRRSGCWLAPMDCWDMVQIMARKSDVMDKLIRDRIPAIIATSGCAANVKTRRQGLSCCDLGQVAGRNF